MVKVIFFVELNHGAHLELEGEKLLIEDLLTPTHTNEIQSENFITFLDQM